MREWVFKMRGGLWTLLFVIILFMAKKTTPTQIFISLPIILIGQLWRCWTVGYIGLYRGENVKAQKLATTGAYSLMRNPLYFGNFLIGLGWSIIAGVIPVIIFVVSFYILYCVVIIPHEEKFLLSKFGLEYSNYCKNVKRFWPTSLSNLSVSSLAGRGITKIFDMNIIMKSEIHTIISTIIGTIIIIVVCYT
ncbi:MAG: isoprenylcysteine carboxylmethyltransferase family protein [Synergistaceae bacterium]|nr:isoprenylcysteine carboxylmethyltransferase family protein [Synergistaceae bacterium]MBQ6435667.1 isoprenylcysteine carboxylmethyltransferase family protein [Synergistaceae bacterium]MBQ7067573.1 isoprenylcysteine carboxylmethyltransferase family protein [Synergistaceae bacterium]MBR0075977.1 isoprenylcysteine carboxylmethyltransferase family protein [Synergistaceae bacterium]